MLVEDDYVKPGDFRDLERHRLLEEKAKKNVAKAEKSKEPKRTSNFTEKKPSIASASRKSTKRS